MIKAIHATMPFDQKSRRRFRNSSAALQAALRGRLVLSDMITASRYSSGYFSMSLYVRGSFAVLLSPFTKKIRERRQDSPTSPRLKVICFSLKT